MAGVEDEPRAVQPGTRQISRKSEDGPLSLARLAIRYPVLTLGFWVVVSALGLSAFFSLKLALFPDIAFPVVVVTARSHEIDPQSNERDVTRPLERSLSSISGLSRIHSLSYPEFVVIDLSFDVGEDLEARKQSVAQAIAAVKLPAGTAVNVTPINLNETAVVSYALVQEGRSMAQLGDVAEREVASKLRALPGVLKVDVVGANQSGPGASAYRLNGIPAVAVNVVKTGSANALDVAEACDDVVGSLIPQVHGVRIVRAASQAPYIREASRATLEALGLALLLAILVIWPFLHDWKPTMISALAVPTVLLGTAFVMKLLHFNLETITLLALALVVGVIVDDQIVAVENIVRHIEDGETPRQSAYRANREIGRTMVACTLTVVAVFLPIGLMRGTLGQFFKPFGLTASAAVLLSLLAARSLSPTLAASWLRPVLRSPQRAQQARHPQYRRIIAWSLNHRAIVVGVAILAFVGGLALIPVIPKGFIPHLDRGEFHITFQLPLGTSMPDMISAATTLENSVKADPAVSDIYATIGGQNGTSSGLLDVHLKSDRRVKTVDVENAVRARLPQIDGLQSSVGDVPFVGTDSSKPLQFYFIGSDLDKLRTLGRNFEHRLQATKGFVDVTASGLSDGTPFSAIEHVDGKRAVGIAADLDGLQLGDANDEVADMARPVTPRGIKLSFGGTSRDAVTTFQNFGIALALSVAAIIAVLVVLFGSWIDPLVISVALPLSTVGALFATWVTRENFGMISLMGLVFLFGLVNKNAILLVDCIKRLRTGGLVRNDAILEAGSQRLRPIVMTTAALILGMLPIALGFGAGAELRAPMAVSIIGGLITSTVLSLVVVPVVYTLFDDLRERLRRKPA